MILFIKIVFGILAVLAGLNTLGRGSMYFCPGIWKTEDSMGVCFPEIKFEFPFTNFIISLFITILLIVIIVIL